jgi:hypothetical protein
MATHVLNASTVGLGKVVWAVHIRHNHYSNYSYNNHTMVNAYAKSIGWGPTHFHRCLQSVGLSRANRCDSQKSSAYYNASRTEAVRVCLDHANKRPVPSATNTYCLHETLATAVLTAASGQTAHNTGGCVLQQFFMCWIACSTCSPACNTCDGAAIVCCQCCCVVSSTTRLLLQGTSKRCLRNLLCSCKAGGPAPAAG